MGDIQDPGVSTPACASRFSPRALLEGGVGKIALALAVTATVVLGAEGVARVADLPTPLILGPTPWNCKRRDARLGYTFRPSCSGMISETSVRTNAAALRGPEIRDDGSIRILVAGDSCTWGWRVDEAASYPAVLQSLLDARWGAGRFQVVNGGAPGYTSLHGLRFLEDRGLTLRPRIVIAGYLWNDMDSGPDAAAQLAAPLPPAPVVAVHDFLLARSRLFRWTHGRLAAAWPGYVEKQAHRVLPDQYESNLRAIAELLRAHGTDLVLIDWGVDPKNEYRPRLARVARDVGAPLVVYDGPRFDLIHPTAAGNAGLAKRLLATLDAAGHLPPPGS